MTDITTYTVTVNGATKTTTKSTLTYYDVVMLAFDRPMKALQTITYSAKLGPNTFEQGEVSPNGPAIAVRNDMSITCCYTGNA